MDTGPAVALNNFSKKGVGPDYCQVNFAKHSRGPVAASQALVSPRYHGNLKRLNPVET
jgi:hypothetical protein